MKKEEIELLRQAFQLGQQWVTDIQNGDEPTSFNSWVESQTTESKLSAEEVEKATQHEAHEYFKRGQLGLEKAADTERAFYRGAKWMHDYAQSKGEKTTKEISLRDNILLKFKDAKSDNTAELVVSVSEIWENIQEFVFDKLENKYPHNCTNEGNPFCECPPIYETFELDSISTKGVSEEELKKEAIAFHKWCTTNIESYFANQSKTEYRLRDGRKVIGNNGLYTEYLKTK